MNIKKFLMVTGIAVFVGVISYCVEPWLLQDHKICLINEDSYAQVNMCGDGSSRVLIKNLDALNLYSSAKDCVSLLNKDNTELDILKCKATFANLNYYMVSTASKLLKEDLTLNLLVRDSVKKDINCFNSHDPICGAINKRLDTVKTSLSKTDSDILFSGFYNIAATFQNAYSFNLYNDNVDELLNNALNQASKRDKNARN